MSDNLREIYDARFVKLVEEFETIDVASDDFPKAVRNLRDFAELYNKLPTTSTPPAEPTPLPEPTLWERVKCVAANVYDSETTRVFLKAGGAFAGVWYVTHSTVKRDHVLERTAIAQANQRPIS